MPERGSYHGRRTYVTPPMVTHIIIAIGASRVGRGISSVMWVMASNPISDKLGGLSISLHVVPDEEWVCWLVSEL
jgi:hypothetical protein